MDVASEDSVAAGVACAVEAMNGLDTLVNVAGILRSAHFTETTLADFEQVLRINLIGTFLVTRQAIPALRLGNAPHPWGLPEFGLADEYITYAAKPDHNADFQMKRPGKRAHGIIAEDRALLLEELLTGKKKGRTSDKQISYSERGNIQGAQFFAVAGKVYELAKARGLGREIPTEWLLQDIRD